MKSGFKSVNSSCLKLRYWSSLFKKTKMNEDEEDEAFINDQQIQYQ
jgi:hypothetical protein